MASTEDALKEMRELFAQQTQQIQKLSELIVPKIQEINEAEGPLPPNIAPLTESEADSLRMMRLPEVFEWPEEELEGDNESLSTVKQHYTQISKLMVAEQGTPLDKFYDHFLARIGQSMIEEPPMAFSHGKKQFLVKGYRLLPKVLIALVMCIFEEDPLAKHIRRCEAKVSRGMKGYTREDLFLLAIERQTSLRCLWADTCAYLMQLDRDTKGSRYVDKRRFETNMNNYRVALKTTAEAMIRFLNDVYEE